jgi:hypothetical protein
MHASISAVCISSVRCSRSAPRDTNSRTIAAWP